jgi:hypothetical protein
LAGRQARDAPSDVYVLPSATSVLADR